MRAPALSAHALALVLVASACSPSTGGPGIGDSCSLDDPCDDGICNLSGPGEPVCIELDGDIDGDGLPNRSDFCNQQAGGAFDEDGDLLGDDCDPCPIAPPPARADSDNDGVDSPCDPDPTLDGNRITLFQGFNDAALPADWRKEGGTWEVRGGEAVFTATDPNAVAILTAPLPLSSRHLAVQASYRVNRVDATANQNAAGLTSIDRRPAGTTAVTCNGSRVGGMDSLVVNSDVGAMARPFTNLFDPAGLYRLAQLIDNASGACAMRANTQEGGVSATTPGEIPTEAGLSARAADLRFQYLLIVQRPN
ncbi:MAG TPA: hypothetical protein VK932_17680 [Kofleriaceae bacterium]|nr:hypothetical protein [Kofleriaceae bacterium]